MILVVQACALLQTKIPQDHQFVTDGGFGFQVPMSGEWYFGPEQAGQYLFSRKTVSSGSTVLSLVRHGPIVIAGGKPMTSEEIYKVFKRDIERDARGGRANKVKSQFSMKMHKNTECLFFTQVGEDIGMQPPMQLTNDGMICLHPKREKQFIWMAISQRVPMSASLEDMTADENKFFDSLQFL
jgi:hypothetical protein